ncbi:predicted protein [Naegleria gruberi]|uniref:Predicted protein n=1 Tax=Naegleria gruberi TaxID=5762 RepID=D2VVX9_NAEGR|nr:uncharacterized protein NAEGRDRAFT_52685 [Naegleria gruberi]EFC38921.1 predicted protein [Naegleria gruberi]|eukprot:XP_002671665.1 predicted protein [Naegleria gruberi strain NEG-M]
MSYKTVFKALFALVIVALLQSAIYLLVVKKSNVEESRAASPSEKNRPEFSSPYHHQMFLNYSSRIFTESDYSHQRPGFSEIMKHDLKELYKSMINVDDQVNRALSISLDRPIDFSKMDTYRRRIRRYFEKDRVWDSSMHKHQITYSPFDSVVVPADYFLENYPIYRNFVLPHTEIYMLREKNVHAIYDNDYSTTLQTLAKHIVGEECWKKKIVMLHDTFHFHSGGPRKVGITLMSALKLIGKEFISTEDIDSPDVLSADAMYSYHPIQHTKVVDRLLREKLKDNFVYFVGPTIAPDIHAHHYSRLGDKVRVLTASHWVKYHDYGPALPKSMKLLVYPTPINTKIWSPKPKQEPPSMDGVLYIKNCGQGAPETVKSLTESLLKNNAYFSNSTLHFFGYGGYTEPQYWKLLREKARFAVVCVSTETQGIALEEMMSMNIPLFILWDKGNSYREADSPTSVPYFSEGKTGVISKFSEMPTTFPDFLKKVETNQFQPRQYVANVFNYFDLAVSFLDMACNLKSTFEPREEYLSKFKNM